MYLFLLFIFDTVVRMTHTTDNNVDCDVKGTIDVWKYVSQLEKRLSEQEELIGLLREKISNVESGNLYANAVKVKAPSVRSVSNPQAGSSGDGILPRSQLNDGASKRHRYNDSNALVGSRKTDIASVPTVKSFQLFVSRIDPSITAQQFAEDLLSGVPELSAVKCSKMKTKHPSYTSFHVLVPEPQRPLVWTVEAWPEGSLIREFTGKLLQSHVVEEFDSKAPVISTANSSAEESSKTKDPVVKSSSGANGGKAAPLGKPSTRKATSSVGSVANPKSPANPASSPKNSRTRAALKNV